MDSKKIVDKFYGIFYSNREKFVRHTLPFTVTDSGKIKPARCYYVYKNPAKKEEGFMPLGKEQYTDHLAGRVGCAVEPLFSDKNNEDVCYYALIDIDCYKPTHAYLSLIKRLEYFGYVFSAVISKSGGLHIYFIFKTPENAEAVRTELKKIVTIFALDKIYKNVSDTSAVEIFPMHDKNIKGRNGKCVFLPYFDAQNKGKAIKGHGKVLSSVGKTLGLIKGLEHFEQRVTTLSSLQKATENLPYSDAPYCIQAILLSGALKENSGRNNFMFSVGNYLKKKHNDGFFGQMLKADKMLLAPIQEEDNGKEELKSTFESVLSKEWHYSCRKSPLCDFCNKSECKQREFSGVAGTNPRKNKVTGADSIGKISKYLAKVPYYGWEITAPDCEPKEVVFNDIKEITSQTIVQQKCWETLGWAFAPVTSSAWTDIMNGAMEGIQKRQIQVDKSSDTSELNELEDIILSYITQRCVSMDRAYMLKLGQVVFHEKKYYFTTEGLKSHLRAEHFKVVKYNLREILLNYGCTVTTLPVKMADSSVSLACWCLEQTKRVKEQAQAYEDAKQSAILDAKNIITAVDIENKELEDNIKEGKF